MGLPKYAARRDKNENEVARAFEKLGFSVERLSQKGVPDLIVAFGGMNVLVEVKTKTGKLTDDQIAFRAKWRGAWFIIRTVEDATRLAKKIREIAQGCPPIKI